MEFISFNQKEWQHIHSHLQMSQSPTTALPTEEISGIFYPLADFLRLIIQNKRTASHKVADHLHLSLSPTPFLIGISGSVAAGKSTTAKILAQLLSTEFGFSKTEVLSTDHFLFPNRVLQEKGIMDKKGFPVSYDYVKLHDTLHSIKSGVESVQVPVYSHVTYDILPKPELIECPDVLFVEGINVLQTNTGDTPISDLLDFTLYVDADVENLFQWYWERIQSLVAKAPENPNSYFNRFIGMEHDALLAMAQRVWEDINLRNLFEHILPTRERADIILKKGPNHVIETIQIAKKWF